MRNYIAVFFLATLVGSVVHGQTTSPSTQPSLSDLVDPSAKWVKLGHRTLLG